jgi:hypothetical protein
MLGDVPAVDAQPARCHPLALDAHRLACCSHAAKLHPASREHAS